MEEGQVEVSQWRFVEGSPGVEAVRGRRRLIQVIWRGRCILLSLMVLDDFITG